MSTTTLQFYRASPRTSRRTSQARHRLIRRVSLVALFAALPLVVAADDSIYLKAKHITMDQRTGEAIYQGKVRLSRGELFFAAGKAIVRQNNGDINTIKAFGNPVIVKKRNSQNNALTTVSGQRLTYMAKPNKLIVTGKVVIRQGNDVIKSARVTYGIKNDTIVAEGLNKSARINAVFQIDRLVPRAGHPEHK